MKGVDFQASVANLPHVDRHQSEPHRMPMVHQQHNIEHAGKEATERIRMPVKPDEVEGKITDAGDHPARENKRDGKRRRREPERKVAARVNRGHFIDVDA